MADTYWDLFLGYGAIWTLIVLFLLKLGYEQRNLAKRIDELDSRQKSTK